MGCEGRLQPHFSSLPCAAHGAALLLCGTERPAGLLGPWQLAEMSEAPGGTAGEARSSSQAWAAPSASPAVGFGLLGLSSLHMESLGTAALFPFRCSTK